MGLFDKFKKNPEPPIDFAGIDAQKAEALARKDGADVLTETIHVWETKNFS